MKRSVPYEIIAAASATVGAIFLMFAYYPVINPVQYGLDSRHAPVPTSRYVLGTSVSLLILGAAWWCNCKAQKLKRDENVSAPVQTPST